MDHVPVTVVDDDLLHLDLLQLHGGENWLSLTISAWFAPSAGLTMGKSLKGRWGYRNMYRLVIIESAPVS